MDIIPKKCYLYWGGGVLSYLRYLTVYSFMKFNSDWEVYIYTPTVPSKSGHSWCSHEQKYTVSGKNYVDQLRSLGVKFVQVDFNKFGIPPQTSEVFKADILRWHLLSGGGGFWSDFDIVYFKPLSAALGQAGEFDTLMCWHEYCSIGFLMASRNNKIFEWARNTCMKNFDPTQYESLGCWLFMGKFKTLSDLKRAFPENRILNIPKSVVYPLDSNHIDQIYNGDHSNVFVGSTIGLHWYAGSKIAGDFQNMVTAENAGKLNNTLGAAIKRAIA